MSVLEIGRLAALLPLVTALALSGCGSSGGGSGGAGGTAATGGSGGSGGTASCAADLSADPENCGQCGRSCYGGQCQAGRCAPVAIATQGFAARTDGVSVTWLDVTESRMARLDLKTGLDARLCPAAIAWSVWPDGNSLRAYASDVVSCDAVSGQSSTVSVGVQSPRAFTLLGNDVVFLSEQDGLVYFAASDGSNVTNVTLPPQHNAQPSATAANSDSFFVIFRDYQGGTSDGEGILRFRKAALTKPETVTLTYPSDGAKAFQWIAADETHVYATRVAATDDVVRVSLETGAIEVLEPLEGTSFGIAIGATDVYWLAVGGGAFGLYRRPKTGGPSELVRTFDGEPQNLFARNGVMTWHSLDPYTVYYMRVD